MWIKSFSNVFDSFTNSLKGVQQHAFSNPINTGEHFYYKQNTMHTLTQQLLYCPGDVSCPCLAVSCAQPPAKGVPPFFSAYSAILASNSGRKCLIRPWIGHAKASPRAIVWSAPIVIALRRFKTYHKWCDPQLAWSTPVTYQSRVVYPFLAQICS